MPERTDVPAWLGIRWYWLLVAGALIQELCQHSRTLERFSDVPVYIWPCLQASWLKRVFPQSRTIYWLLGLEALYLVFKTPLLMLRFGTLTSWHFAQQVITYAPIALIFAFYIVSIFTALRDFEAYAASTDGVQPAFSGTFALLFGTYYFQAKLSEMYDDRNHKLFMLSLRE